MGLLAGRVSAWEVPAVPSRSLHRVSESSESQVHSCRATSGPTRPAGLAVAGRRPSYPSRVRVENRVGPNAAGRPCRGGPQTVVSESRPSYASRVRLSAARFGGGVVSFKFVVNALSESPRSRVFGLLALRRSARDGAVCRAAPATA